MRSNMGEALKSISFEYSTSFIHNCRCIKQVINKTSIFCKNSLTLRKQAHKVHDYNEQRGHTVLPIHLLWNIWYVDVRCGVCNIFFCTIHSCTFYYYVKITGNIELANRKKYVSSNNDCGNTSFLYCFVHLQKWYKYLSDYII